MNITTLVGFDRISGEKDCAELLAQHLNMSLLRNKPLKGKGSLVSSGNYYYPTGDYVKALEELDTDVVFISTIGEFAEQLKKIVGKYPTVLQLGQNIFEFAITPGARNAIGNLLTIMSMVDAIVAPSKYAEENVRALGLRNVIHIPGPIDTKRYKRADGNSTDILMAGRLELVKNYITPMLAVSSMTEFVNIGMGIFGTGSMHQFYKNFANKTKNKHRFKFYGYRNLEKIYAQARMFIQPSLSEMASRTVKESMAAGCPIVASNIGGHKFSDAIEFVEPDSIKEFRDAITKLYTDDDLWEEKHKQLLKDVQKFDVRKIKDEYLALFNLLAKVGKLKT